MEEPPVNKSQDPTKNIEEGPKKPIDLEAIKKDRGLLEFLYDRFTKEVSLPNVAESGQQVNIRGIDESDFLYGNYSVANISEITFYICYLAGLDFSKFECGRPILRDYAIEYLKCLLDGRDFFLSEKLKKYREEGQQKLSLGFKLSGIIPGAPDLITESAIGKPDSPNFLSRDTAKVGDILHLSKVKRERLNLVAEAIEGKSFVDLAAAQGISSLQLAKEMGAQNYVAVEPFNTFETLFWVRYLLSNEEIEFDKIHISKTDMLTFLKKIPNESKDLVFLISGVDDVILGRGSFSSVEGDKEKAKTYVDGISSELKRVMGEGCHVLVFASFDPCRGDRRFVQEIAVENFSAEGPLTMYKIVN